MLRPAKLLLALFVTTAICSASTAYADPAESERERARDLVYHGDMLFAEKRYGEALEAYSTADEIMKVPTTGIEVAKTLASLGRLVEAREVAAGVEAFATKELEPEPFAQARQRATLLVRELDARIPTVALEIVPRVKTRLILVDKQPVPDSRSWSPIRMDPGRHIISVQAQGFAVIAQPIDVKEGERAVLEVKLPEKIRGPGSVALAGFIVSGIALTAGAIAGGAYLDQRATLEEACAVGGSTCDIGNFDRVNAIGWTANLGFVLAAAGAAVGGISYGLEVGRERTMKDMQMNAVVTPGFTGLQGRF
jgi:hypothetical protein